MRAWPRALALAGAAVITAAQRPARAVDPFEIQVYDGTADPPGVASLEVHLNGVVRGLETAPAPELPPNHQVHLTFEPAYGVTRIWEVGAYLQTAWRADGAYDFAGWKLRSKLVTPPGWSPRARLGVNVELSALPRRYEADRWGGEIRPIGAWKFGPVDLWVNPIVEISFTGGAPSFEPAVALLYEFPGLFSFGLESYAGLGAITGFDVPRDQVHYLYEVVNLLAVKRLELNVGVGEGLTPASNGLILKMIVGYAFDRAAGGARR